MKLFQNTILLVVAYWLSGCRQEYVPQVKSREQSVLVVEGVLNSGDGPTTLKLSRTFKLDDTSLLWPETGAWLVVEGQNGDAFPLVDSAGNGSYSIAQLPLNPTLHYRLAITTADGRRYASDYVPVLKNPPIDSISWKRDETGVTIFINTHNPENNTRHYRWEFEETWQLHSAYSTYLKVVNNVPIKRRLPEEQVRDCWQHHHSSNILLGSTTRLGADVVFERPLIVIPEASAKLSVRYSVLVRQYALDKRGYAFYQLMQKITESLGSIFDAQPTELTGNIHPLTDSNEQVIGYITAAPIREARIFITAGQVPGWKFRLDCTELKYVPNNPDSLLAFFNGEWLPVSEIYAPGGILAGYDSVRPPCTDCTVRGDGSTWRPVYW